MCLPVKIQELLCDLLLGQLAEGGDALSLAEHEPAVAGDALSGPVIIGLVVGVDAMHRVPVRESILQLKCCAPMAKVSFMGVSFPGCEPCDI